MLVIGNRYMEKIKVLHQVLDPSGIGGVSTEFRALQNSELSEKYEFSSMVLMDSHRGVNLHDVRFYYKKIKEIRPDIIHIRGAALDGLNAVIAAKLYGKAKIFVAVHGMYSDKVFISSAKRWFSEYVVEGLTFGIADGISCVCKRITDRTYFDKYRKKMLPFVYNRMPHYNNEISQVHRNEIRSKYGIAENAVVGLFLGRMTKEKGIDDMIISLDIIPHEALENFVLLMVGDGDYFNACKEICKDKAYKVIFAGSQKDTEKFYHAADFFIMPSLHENHSISLLEACAAQLPSIATDCGGNAETITTGKTGLIVPVGSVSQMVGAILRMLDYSERAKFKKCLATEDFSRFSNEECDKALDSAYESILKNI